MGYALSGRSVASAMSSAVGSLYNYDIISLLNAGVAVEDAVMNCGQISGCSLVTAMLEDEKILFFYSEIHVNLLAVLEYLLLIS